MKAISLWQPWASLIIWGEKEYETRSWPAPRSLIGQDIVIHAAKRPIDMEDWPDFRLFQGVLVDHGCWLNNRLPYGAVLGVAHVKGCWPVEQVRTQLSAKELAFGNYSDGRFAWWLTDIRPFAQPILYRGAQGLFEYVPPEGVSNA